MESITAPRATEETRTGPATLALICTGLRDGLIVAGCAFLAGAVLVSVRPARG